MGRTLSRLATAGLIALATGALGLSAGSASAATVPVSNAAPDALQCGWNPANDANAEGKVDSSLVVGNIYMFAGPDYGCGHINPDPGAVNNYGIVIHCGWYNANEGLWWDYLQLGDPPYGPFGWIPNKDVVRYTGSPDGC